ncbi:MAG: hypothetical protein EOO38_09330 [Cytophagaceae bacterium]|nr:MAG: hypothetical protein EOO38_09330 [Cytophagaceae bacterium]
MYIAAAAQHCGGLSAKQACSQASSLPNRLLNDVLMMDMVKDGQSGLNQDLYDTTDIIIAITPSGDPTTAL